MLAVYQDGDKPVPGYQLVRFLGRGGFGQVWKARAPGGTEVALKLIDLQGHQGIKEFRAIRLVKTIRHPNLAPILAFWLKDQGGKIIDDADLEGTDSGEFLDRKPAELIIAMGLGDKNLLDRLQECKKEEKSSIPVQELLKYMEAAAEAIDFLNSPTHNLGKGTVAIHHGDIKPQNILIVGGAAQVCDFGLASVLGDARSTNPTASFAYVAPETLDNNPTKWTDQYSLAISYCELRTGELPFQAANMPMILRAHAEGKLDFSKLTPPEQVVLKKATDLNPAFRYPTTVEMVKALRRAIEGTRGPGTVATLGPGGEVRLQPGMELVPGYRLVQHLGSGSYGKVWEAAAPGGIHVALKIIEQLGGASGKQEFKALELIKRVEHSHLMDLLAYWLLDKEGQLLSDEDRTRADCPQPATLIIACKLAKKNLGQRLKECLTKTGQGIPPLELLRYMRQAAKAIDHLNTPQHRLDDDKVVSIQHRDIKPENILLAGDAVKVADFGLAKIVEGSSAMVHSGSAGLTLAYAAPEMFENKVTQWTDQYCLAVTYYHLRTGTLPFTNANSPNEIISAHLYGRLDLTRLTPAEQKVIARATSTLPELRFPNCVEMVEGLYKAVFGDNIEDDSFLMDQKAVSGAHAGVVSHPVSSPATAATPTQTAMPTKGQIASIAGAVSVATPPRPGRESTKTGGETFTDGIQGTLQPSQLPRRQPAPPSKKVKTQPTPSGKSILPWVVAVVVVAAGGIGLGVYLLKAPKPPDSGSASSGSPSVNPATEPSAAVPPTAPTTPIRPNVAEELQRGTQLLAGNFAGAQATFAALIMRTDLPLAERRQALLGLARAQARLNQWNDLANSLKQLQGGDFESLPPLRDEDLANVRALGLIQSESGIAETEMLKRLAALNKEQLLNRLKDWEKKRIEEVIGVTVQRVAVKLPEKSPLEAAAMAKDLFRLQKPSFSLYDKLARSVLQKTKPPADNEADLDQQMEGVLELFADANVEDADKQKLVDLQAKVLAKDVEWRIPFADRSTNWAARLEKCQKAQKTGSVLACRIECRVEKWPRSMPPEELQASQRDLQEKEWKDTDYGVYVRARLQQAEGREEDALKTILTLDYQSPWLTTSDRNKPRYRGSKAADILLLKLAVIGADVRKASDKLAGDLSNPETLEKFFVTLHPALQRIVRAYLYDQTQTAARLEQLKILLESFAAPNKALANKAPLERVARKKLENNQLDEALECALGFKFFGGNPVEAAELLGMVYALQARWIPALDTFNEALPRKQNPDPKLPALIDLDKVGREHYDLLMQRTYLIVLHNREFPREKLPFPEAIIQPAEKAVELAKADEILKVAKAGEAVGAAGWAYHYAAEQWDGDERTLKEIGPWRMAAINRCIEALQIAPPKVKKDYAWKWRSIIGMEVERLLSKPDTAAMGEQYRGTAKTQLSKGIEELNDAIKEIETSLKKDKDISAQKKKSLEEEKDDLSERKKDLEQRLEDLTAKKPQ